MNAMIIRDKEKVLAFPVTLHSPCSLTTLFSFKAFYSKGRRSPSLGRNVLLLHLILGTPNGRKAKQHTACFLFCNYDSGWRKKTQRACKKPLHHTPINLICALKAK